MTLLTIQEVSALLRVKPKTIYQWAEQSQIPCVKLNGALRFDQDAILKWVDSCKREPCSSYNPLTRNVASSPKKGGGR